ncbi:unnamed protein product [Ostreobium quekettii]|uniref:Uncharacterized protein n=1 Tax=Ostreobium quekettii TaxID=121088 RepID=A0A8S1IL77_9CHLO|nr:unnamed protein product [Ostreobium quekettii]
MVMMRASCRESPEHQAFRSSRLPAPASKQKSLPLMLFLLQRHPMAWRSWTGCMGHSSELVKGPMPVANCTQYLDDADLVMTLVTGLPVVTASRTQCWRSDVLLKGKLLFCFLSNLQSMERSCANHIKWRLNTGVYAVFVPIQCTFQYVHVQMPGDWLQVAQQ